MKEKICKKERKNLRKLDQTDKAQNFSNDQSGAIATVETQYCFYGTVYKRKYQYIQTINISNINLGCTIMTRIVN